MRSRLLRAATLALPAGGLAGCDSIAVIEDTAMRAEYTGSLGTALVAGLCALTVAGALSHLWMRFRTPTRGNLFTDALLGLAAFAGLYLFTQPLILGVVADRGSGTVTVTSRAPRELLLERVRDIPIREVQAVEVQKWPAWLPTTPVRVIQLVLSSGETVPIDIGFDCLDMRTVGIRVASITGHTPPDWRGK